MRKKSVPEQTVTTSQKIKLAGKFLKTRVSSIKLPKLTFQDTPINGFLVFSLVIFAFVLGMLTNKVIFLQQEVTALKAIPTPDPSAQAGTGAAAAAVPTPPPYVNVDKGHFPLKGDSNAKVTVIEFGDLRCPFCEKFFSEDEGKLLQDYVDTGKVNFAFRNYAFLGPASTLAANAAECANDQGKFWDFHDYLYKNQPDESDTSMYTVDNLTQVAGDLGMDTTKFNNCLSTTADSKSLAEDMSAATDAQVDGTPTFFINGQRIVGAVPYDQLKQAIDAELKKVE